MTGNIPTTYKIQKHTKMKKNSIITNITALMFSALCCPAFAQSKVTRTDLQKHDLSIPGKETVQARIDFPPHSAFGFHNHPGEEIIYVLEGALEYQLEGQLPVTLKAGEVLFVPAGVYHSAKNSGNIKASELATYVVEKGKPLVTIRQ
jgi:quercetin dioxygenase-like cupin family protein